LLIEADIVLGQQHRPQHLASLDQVMQIGAACGLRTVTDRAAAIGIKG
jgi:hypothetical protein